VQGGEREIEREKANQNEKIKEIILRLLF